MRFLFYSHDGLGLGHMRRHLAVAAALTEMTPEASVLLASGADDVNCFDLPRHVEILKLPGLRKVDNDHYVARRLRISTTEIRALRSALLQAAVKAFRPAVVLVDKHPFGASGEFRNALSTARQHGAKTALGLRDILDAPATVRKEWAQHGVQEGVAANYDAVLIYGNRFVFDPVTEYELPPEVAERTHFCGYLVNRESAELRPDSEPRLLALPACQRPVVLASAGGGEDGYRLLKTFIRAAAQASWQGVVIAGPMTPTSSMDLLRRMAAEAQVDLHSFVPNLDRLFDSVDALVCMGGYNTLAEAVSRGVSVVSVPRISPRSEQLIRAEAFERLGLLRLLRPEQLNVESLRHAVDTAIGRPRAGLLERAHSLLNFDGSRRAAAQLLSMATTPAPVVAAPAEKVSG
jgi:predicted glycosyltransferase